MQQGFLDILSYITLYCVLSTFLTAHWDLFRLY